jgi:hypothetical protein
MQTRCPDSLVLVLLSTDGVVLCLPLRLLPMHLYVLYVLPRAVLVQMLWLYLLPPSQCALGTRLNQAMEALTVVRAPCLATCVRRSASKPTAANRLRSARRTALGVQPMANAS